MTLSLGQGQVGHTFYRRLPRTLNETPVYPNLSWLSLHPRGIQATEQSCVAVTVAVTVHCLINDLWLQFCGFQ